MQPALERVGLFEVSLDERDALLNVLGRGEPEPKKPRLVRYRPSLGADVKIDQRFCNVRPNGPESILLRGDRIAKLLALLRRQLQEIGVEFELRIGQWRRRYPAAPTSDTTSLPTASMLSPTQKSSNR